MVTGKITAVCGVPGSAFPAVKPGAPQVVAYVGSSVQSAALGGVVVRVVSTTDCHIAFGANPTATATSMLSAGKGARVLHLQPDRQGRGDPGRGGRQPQRHARDLGHARPNRQHHGSGHRCLRHVPHRCGLPVRAFQPSGRGDPPVRERQRQDRATLPPGRGRETLHRAARLPPRRRPPRAPRLLGVEVRSLRRVHLQRAQRRRQRHHRLHLPLRQRTSVLGDARGPRLQPGRYAGRDPGFEPHLHALLDGDPVPAAGTQGRSAVAGAADDSPHQDPASPERLPRHLSLRPALHHRRAVVPAAPGGLRWHLAGHGERGRRRHVHLRQRRPRDARPGERRGPVPRDHRVLALPRRAADQARPVEGRHHQLAVRFRRGVQGHRRGRPVRTESPLPDAEGVALLLEGVQRRRVPVLDGGRARSGPLPRLPTPASATRDTTRPTAAWRTA